MAQLEFVRTDGETAILRAPDGTEYELPITPELRDAVCPQQENCVPTGETTEAVAAKDLHQSASARTTAADHPPELLPVLRPRDIQTRLRAGDTIESLSLQSGISLAVLKKLEWPVVTEREHVIRQVREHEVSGLAGVAELGEIADSRLASRGVSREEAFWSARREGGAPWVVEVRFSVGERDRTARWTYEPRGKAVIALDDEARWLGQPDDPLTLETSAPTPAKPRSPVITRRSSPQPDLQTDRILDDLAARRGARPATGPIPTRLPMPVDTRPAAKEPVVNPPVKTPAPVVPPPISEPPMRGRRRAEPASMKPLVETPRTEPAYNLDRGSEVVELRRWTPRRAATGPSIQPTLLPASGAPIDVVRPPVTPLAPMISATPPVYEMPTLTAVTPIGDDEVTYEDDQVTYEDEPVTYNEPPAVIKPESSAPDPVPPVTATPAGGVSRRGKNKRAQVPSWDEIVFGAKS